MPRDPRYIPEGGSVVEITNRTLHGRYLLRPDPAGQMNVMILGVLGRAQRLYKVRLFAVSVLSNHAHALAHFEDAEQMALFMGYFNTGVSKELTRLVDWPGKVWARPYRPVLVTDEGSQIARLRYILAAGAKEGLVDRPAEWPGVQSVRNLLHGEPLRGLWFDRTDEWAARNRGEEYGHTTFATVEEVVLDQLPCWAHLSPEEYRQAVAGLVQEIEEEAALEREATGRPSLGAEAIVKMDPHTRPAKLERSPAPRIHAMTKAAFDAMMEALSLVFAAYREASERLRNGDRLAVFPEGTFPPHLSFVAFASGLPP